MVTNTVQEWLFVCVLSLLGTNTAATNGFYKTMPLKGVAARWSMDSLKKRITVSELNQVEPGFDFTDAEIKKFKLWPSGVVSYYIDDFSYDKVLRDRIRSFLDVASGLTGLHFQELPSPPEDKATRWIFFVNRQGLLGCSDHSTLNSKNEGVQKVTLGYNCMSQGGELPEAVLAIAGVPPQHNSPDRDLHITVEIANILPEKQYLFEKLQDSDWLFHDLDYDFSSAGHFNFHKHTKDGLATIKPKNNIEIPVGENDGFSYNDILKVRMLYNYISKNKLKTIKGPECNKLFEPGSNFSNFQLNPDNEIAPRVKPNRYLGLPDRTPKNDKKDEEKVQNEEEENSNEENADVKNTDEKNADEDNADEGKADEENTDKENADERNADKENAENKNDNSDADDGAETKSQLPLKRLKIDPLTVLSDYETDDGRPNTKDRKAKKRRN